ncbi:CsiV family protein [Thiomicrospira pelophila]|uniref:CsiV family protein n=1 Tax=Thiomicrospira pelophila TaxID=934 RepID=UPI00068C71EE|nr:CsiV family protein [Thiomicrospira pelophila]
MKLLVIALTSLISWLPFQVSAEDEKAPPKVQIEVIVFQSLALRGWTEEYWPDILALPDTENATQFNAEDGYARLLTAESFTLNEEVEKMTTEKGYDVLAHFAWRQNALSREEALPVLVDQFVQQRRLESSILFGTIRMYQERFPHVQVNLEIDRQIPQAVLERFTEHQHLDIDWITEGWRFQINESRRVRFGEIHYLDHPIFGVLIKVDRVK